MKKCLLLVLAALLIMGALAGCGEQGNTPAPGIPVSAKDPLPSDSTFTSGKHEKLLSLRFDGYEEMTIAEFRDKVGAATDTKEYADLFERLPKDTALQELKDTDEDAEFLFYILPLAGEDWKTRSYSGEVTSSYAGEKARLEYSFTLRNKTKDELRDEAAIRADVQSQIDHLLQNINQTAELSATIEFAYFPLPAAGKKPQVPGANGNGNQETRRAEHGTKEDDQSLPALKTPDYASMNVAVSIVRRSLHDLWHFPQFCRIYFIIRIVILFVRLIGITLENTTNSLLYIPGITSLLPFIILR